jgi:hypothetical protein
MKYYISGKITDIDRETELYNMQLFYDKEMEMIAEGIPPENIFNPARLEVDGGATWEYYLARDLHHIMEEKPTLILLPNWKESKGARLEVELAHLLKLPVIEP